LPSLGLCGNPELTIDDPAVLAFVQERSNWPERCR